MILRVGARKYSSMEIVEFEDISSPILALIISLIIILVENKRPNFDTFPPLFILRIRHLESSVWDPSRPAVKLRIEALDQQHLVRR
jgi:hypothetical protein